MLTGSFYSLGGVGMPERSVIELYVAAEERGDASEIARSRVSCVGADILQTSTTATTLTPGDSLEHSS